MVMKQEDVRSERLVERKAEGEEGEYLSKRNCLIVQCGPKRYKPSHFQDKTGTNRDFV